MRNAGFVVGLAAEARIARRLGLVEIGGGRTEGAEAAAERLVARHATALVSFGLAGGLDPALRPGDLVVPAVVLLDGVHIPTNPALATALGAPAGLLLAGNEVIADAGSKGRIFAETGAGTVDLETAGVARAAARHGLPFAVLRAVCDPAGRTLPPAALAALDEAGVIGLWRVIAALAARPRQLPDLLALARDAASARRALLARVRALSA